MRQHSIRQTVAACGSALALLVLACSPDVGSKAWCEKMADKPKGDWSANDTADYAKHCLFD